jgi:Flp pilus assembly protein TadD
MILAANRRGSHALVAFLLFWMSVSPPARGDDTSQVLIPSKDKTALEQAVRLRQSKPQEAITQLEALTVRQPEYYKAWYNLGLAYADENSYANAIRSIEKAKEVRAKHQITDSTIFNSAGYVYMLAGQAGKAEENFKQALDFESNLPLGSKRKLYNNLGSLYLSTGRYQDAEKYLTYSAEELHSSAAREQLKTLRSLRAAEAKPISK